MKKYPSLASFSAKNRRSVELLRSQDPASWEEALASGNLDEQIGEEMLRLLQHSRNLELRLQLLEQIALELDSGLYGGIYSGPYGGLYGGLYSGLYSQESNPPASEAPPLFDAPTFDRLQSYLRSTFLDARENPRLRRKALEVVVLTPQPWQEEAIRECWLRPEPEWQATAVFCMGHFLLEDFTEEILAALGSPLDDLRECAILAADNRDLRSLGKAIQQIAVDPRSELEVRLCAIEALPNLRPEGAREVLDRLCREPEPIGHFAASALFSLDQNLVAESKLEAEGEELLRASPPRFFYEEKAAPSPFLRS